MDHNEGKQFKARVYAIKNGANGSVAMGVVNVICRQDTSCTLSQ